MPSFSEGTNAKRAQRQRIYTVRKLRTLGDLPCKKGPFSKEEDAVYLSLIRLDASVLDMLAVVGNRNEIQIRHKIRLLKASYGVKASEATGYKRGFWSIEETEGLRRELGKHPGLDIKHLTSLHFGRQLSQLLKTRSSVQCVAKVKNVLGCKNSTGDTKVSTLDREAPEATRFPVPGIPWTPIDICLLEAAVARYGITDFGQISTCFPGRPALSCRKKWVPNRYQGCAHSGITAGAFDADEQAILRGLLKVIPVGVHSPFNVFFPGRSFKQVYYNLNKLLSADVPAVFAKFRPSEVLDVTDFYLYDGCDWARFLPTLHSRVSVPDCQLVIAHLAARPLVRYIDLPTHRAIRAKYRREKAASVVLHALHTPKSTPASQGRT